MATDQNEQERTARQRLAVRLLLGAGKVLGVVISLTVLAACGAYAFLWYQPLLLLNPISAFPHSQFLACRDEQRCPSPDQSWVSMVPKVFTMGEAKQHVLQRLEQAGFTYWLADGPSMQFRMAPGMYNLLCYQYYNIEITFDTSDQLPAARSSISGTPTCV